MKPALITICAFLIVAAMGGCGSDGDNRLWGSAETSYDLAFDGVEIDRQVNANDELDAIIIRYVRGSGEGKETPVKVVAKAPLEAGTKRDITGDGGSISRIMQDASAFHDMEVGNVDFDSIGGDGDTTEGEFHVTFTNGRTLNGAFSATTKLLKL